MPNYWLIPNNYTKENDFGGASPFNAYNEFSEDNSQISWGWRPKIQYAENDIVFIYISGKIGQIAVKTKIIDVQNEEHCFGEEYNSCITMELIYKYKLPDDRLKFHSLIRNHSNKNENFPCP